MYYLGIDIGGTYIKGGIVKTGGEIVAKGQDPSQAELGAQTVMDNVASLMQTLCQQAGITPKDIRCAGAGIPGIMDTEKGVVIYNNNLGWRKVKFCEYMRRKTGVDFCLSNDANMAAFGEAIYGSGKGCNTSVFVTLGTGVGGGVVIDGKIFEGNKGAGAELGHMVIRSSGEKCTCGRRGCLEMYASATALINQTRRQMQKDSDSKLWQLCGGDMEKVNGKTAFLAAAEDDISAKKVVNYYTNMLAEGLANFANIFRPEVILLGGGISKEGETLTEILRKKLKKRIYGGKMGPYVEIRTACLKNDAGFLGAAALAMQKSGQTEF